MIFGLVSAVLAEDLDDSYFPPYDSCHHCSGGVKLISPPFPLPPSVSPGTVALLGVKWETRARWCLKIFGITGIWLQSLYPLGKDDMLMFHERVSGWECPPRAIIQPDRPETRPTSEGGREGGRIKTSFLNLCPRRCLWRQNMAPPFALFSPSSLSPHHTNNISPSLHPSIPVPAFHRIISWK